jgi:hypothetical protein
MLGKNNVERTGENASDTALRIVGVLIAKNDAGGSRTKLARQPNRPVVIGNAQQQPSGPDYLDTVGSTAKARDRSRPRHSRHQQ